MKSILLSFIILTFGLSSDAQNQNDKLNIVGPEKPILVINDTILASIDILNKVPTESILTLNVLKESKLSSTNLFIEKKQNEGILKANIDHKFDCKSQQELNMFFGLNEVSDVYVNGYLIENKNQSILTESILKIEIFKADSIRLKKAVLNIELE